MLVRVAWRWRRSLRRARRRRAWGALAGARREVLDVALEVSTPPLAIRVRLHMQDFLHTFCTLSAHAAQHSFSGEYAWSDQLADLSVVVSSRLQPAAAVPGTLILRHACLGVQKTCAKNSHVSCALRKWPQMGLRDDARGHGRGGSAAP